MRYFLIEDKVDISVHNSLEQAVLAIEPVDIPRMKLFDELGNAYALSVEGKKIRFLGIWPSTVDSTAARAIAGTVSRELESYLREFASKVSIKMPANTGLLDLVELIANHQHVRRRKPPSSGT